MVLESLRSYSPQILDGFFGGKEALLPPSSKRKVFFQKKVTSVKEITPYEGAAFSNIPSATNLLLLIPDCYSTVKALKHANKLYDLEAKSDAITRIAGFIPNFISSIGTNVSYGESLHIIPSQKVPTIFGKVFPVFGILLCIIEAIVESVSLKRQISFLKNLHINFFDTDSKTKDTSKSPIENIHATLKALIKENKNFDRFLGYEKSIKYQKALSKLSEQIEKNPDSADLYLREVKRILLHKNLTYLRAKYLELSELEMKNIADKVNNQYKDKLSSSDIQKKLEAAYCKKLTTKKMKLARRIRPGATKAIDDKVNDLIKGLSRKSSTKVQNECIKLGENLMKMIRTQSHKKEIVHIVGILALLFIIAGTSLLLPATPLLADSVILSSVGFGLAVTRYILYKGLLDTEGWKFSAKNCIPKIFIKMFSPAHKNPPKPQRYHYSYTPDIWVHKTSPEEQKRINDNFLKLLAKHTYPSTDNPIRV